MDPEADQVASSGQTASGGVFSSGAAQTVLSGGVASGGVFQTLSNQYVSAGGAVYGVTLSGGFESDDGLIRGLIAVGGSLSGYEYEGFEEVGAGGVALDIVLSSGGYQEVSSGGFVSGAMIYSAAIRRSPQVAPSAGL